MRDLDAITLPVGVGLDEEEVVIPPHTDEVFSNTMVWHCQALSIAITQMRQALEDRVDEVLKLTFDVPFKDLVNERPRKEFVRTVKYEIRKGRYAVSVRWYYLLPSSVKGEDGKRKTILKRFKTLKNGKIVCKGVPNVTPELETLIQEANQAISFAKPMSRKLERMGRLLNDTMKMLDIDASEIALTEAQEAILYRGYNPLYQCEIEKFNMLYGNS